MTAANPCLLTSLTVDHVMGVVPLLRNLLFAPATHVEDSRKPVWYLTLSNIMLTPLDSPKSKFMGPQASGLLSALS